MQAGRVASLAVGALWVVACARGTAAAEDEPAEPEPAGRHCLAEEQTKWVLHQMLVAQVNPGGTELSSRLGLCTPLVTRPGVLFAHTSLEVGVLEYLSPAYGQVGGYVQVTPLSILQLRAELSGLAYWPFPFPRAGYFDLQGYDSDFRPEALPKEDAQTALGWNLNLVGVLRARVRLSDRLGIVALSMWAAERWVVGDGEFYFNLRRDLPLARRDWLVTAESLGAAEIAVDETWAVRLGLFDSFKWVPESGYTANQVGLLVGASWPNADFLIDGMRELQPMLRVGLYTAHEFRTWTVSALLGVLASYDLGGL